MNQKSLLLHVFSGGGGKCNTVCGGLRATYGNRFSPSIIWVPVIKLRLAGWVQARLRMSDLDGPLVLFSEIAVSCSAVHAGLELAILLQLSKS